MAGSMKNSRKLIVDSGKLFAVCCLLFSACSFAAELNDPTRPPLSIAEPVADAGGAAVIPPAGLQSILVGKFRRIAIIDGQTVELGGRIGDAKLVEVNATSVVLRTPQGRRVLTLFPDAKVIARKSGTEVSPAIKKMRAVKKIPVAPMEKK